MAKGAGKLNKTGRRACGIERVDDTPRFRGGVKPVAIEADQAETGFCARKSFRQHAVMRFSQVEIVHGTGDVEVTIGIKPVDKA